MYYTADGYNIIIYSTYRYRRERTVLYYFNMRDIIIKYILRYLPVAAAVAADDHNVIHIMILRRVSPY